MRNNRWTRVVVLTLYILFALIPLYWMLSISLRTNEETMSAFAIWPHHVTFDNYKVIFTQVVPTKPGLKRIAVATPIPHFTDTLRELTQDHATIEHVFDF